MLTDPCCNRQRLRHRFETVEYTISALIDQSLHKLSAAEIASLDLNAFEQKELARLGMPAGIIMRHRPPVPKKTHTLIHLYHSPAQC